MEPALFHLEGAGSLLPWEHSVKIIFVLTNVGWYAILGKVFRYLFFRREYGDGETTPI